MSSPDRQNFVSAMASQYGRRLRRFLSGRLRNAADVPDLAQEVFLRLLRVEDHGHIRSPEAYLFTVASHVIHQHTVRQATAPVHVDIADVFGEPQALSDDDPQATVELQQQITRLKVVLDELPPRLAATLVLARLKGDSLEEIASTLGVSRESVKKYLARALQHCRARQADVE
ncbi:MAG: RNA polymerase sigma factor [Gammaproteobacteria bacterium]